MDEWGWEQLHRWLNAPAELPTGRLSCIIDGPTREPRSRRGSTALGPDDPADGPGVPVRDVVDALKQHDVRHIRAGENVRLQPRERVLAEAELLSWTLLLLMIPALATPTRPSKELRRRR